MNVKAGEVLQQNTRQFGVERGRFEIIRDPQTAPTNGRSLPGRNVTVYIYMLSVSEAGLSTMYLDACVNIGHTFIS